MPARSFCWGCVFTCLRLQLNDRHAHIAEVMHSRVFHTVSAASHVFSTLNPNVMQLSVASEPLGQVL
eukprot:4120855-Amphidinium_carterae.1